MSNGKPERPVPLSEEALRLIVSSTIRLAEDLDRLRAVFESATTSLPASVADDFEQELHCLIGQCYRQAEDPREFQTCVDVLGEIGPILFVQKILWSEDVTEMAMAASLHRLVPGLNVLVEKYPALLMRNAHGALRKLKKGGESG
ncbi:hypothetical protein HBDW_43740 [Herbaspirillum sp. DW155]|uniref:hypothetical protein n=1 Tax=Herbaspirillum sp. DW155 TaxID=3095609 RepID=UPI00308AFF7B|nr:hypothetical protein HBDW_43740 [Herbaspirillum sp. DW155]